MAYSTELNTYLCHCWSSVRRTRVLNSAPASGEARTGGCLWRSRQAVCDTPSVPQLHFYSKHKTTIFTSESKTVFNVLPRTLLNHCYIYSSLIDYNFLTQLNFKIVELQVVIRLTEDVSNVITIIKLIFKYVKTYVRLIKLHYMDDVRRNSSHVREYVYPIQGVLNV